MKKLLAIILVIAMAMSLFACAQGENQTGTEQESQKVSFTIGSSDSNENDDQNEEEDATTPSSSTKPVDAPVDEPDSVALHTMPVYGDENDLVKGSCSNAYGDSFDGPFYKLISYGDNYRDFEYLSQAATSFTLDGSYRYLTGTFFAREDQAESYTIEFMVYADGELIYCSEPIGRKTRSVDFAIDIGDCEVLTITSRSYDYTSVGTNPGIILVNATLHTSYSGQLTPGVKIDPNLVPLSSLRIYGGGDLHVGVVEDSYGKVYKGIYADLCSYGDYVGDFDHQDYLDFVNDGDYRYISGTFFTRNKQSESYQIEFMIYADDRLVYSSGMIGRRDGAVDFEVELGDCNMIRIMSRSRDYTDSGTNPGIIVMDAFVSRQKP